MKSCSMSRVVVVSHSRLTAAYVQGRLDIALEVSDKEFQRGVEMLFYHLKGAF